MTYTYSVYSVAQCTLYTVPQCTLGHSVQCTLDPSVQHTLGHSVLCTLDDSVQCTLGHSVHRTRLLVTSGGVFCDPNNLCTVTPAQEPACYQGLYITMSDSL